MDFIKKLYPGATTDAVDMNEVISYILNQEADSSDLPLVQDPINTSLTET
jgi:hypothetical protein